MPLLSLHLYKKFRGTDAKGLVSLHGLAALNIYFGGSQDMSKIALGEYLKKLTYQALSQENDDIFLSFIQYYKLLKGKKKTKLKKQKISVKK